MISVVICTHNRADRLGEAIQSVLDQRFPPDAFEVVVVDNRSSDATPEVVRAFAAAGPLRYVHEPALGLCRARTAGWQAARGRYVAYLDDDAIACPGWLAAIEEAFAATPTAGIVGGRVDPIWEAERPSWVSDDVALGLTILDWSPAPTLIADVRQRWLVGANMAIPRALLAEVGFHPGLDRIGSRMLSSGDVFLQKQIIQRGYACLYYPAMAVRHRVPAARLTKRWFQQRYYWQGISDAVMRLVEDRPTRTRRLGAAAAIATRVLASPRTLADLLLPTDDPDRFTRKCLAWIDVGQVVGLLGVARG